MGLALQDMPQQAQEIDYQQLLHEKGKILEWLIDGMFIHGLPMRAASHLTKEYICTHYNTEPTYFYLQR